jgi:ATP-dependent Clp protease, protease subunit
MKPTFFAKANGKRGEIYIYEEIGAGWYGGITAKSFAETMKELGNVSALDIYINSPGGSVFDGIAIYNQIKRFNGEKVVHIDGIAASIASVIAMAGDKIRIADNGMMMIHDPWSVAFGTADEMRKMADSLDKVRDTILDTYVLATGGDRADISDLMAAETWLSADESVEKGFATEKGDSKNVLNKADVFTLLAKFKNTPADLRKQASAPNALLARMEMRANKIRRVSPEKKA